MNDILGTDKFRKLSLKENSKPLPMKNETELKDILKRLLKNKSIDQKFEKLLTCQGSQPAKLYGLTKIHKAGHPLRPVLSMIDTVQYRVAKVLDSLLSPLISNDFEIRDSFDFKDFILNQAPKCDSECMVSFDVSSLFTNVPIDETIDLCEKMWDDNSSSVNKIMDKQALKELLKFCAKNVPFLFNDEWYIQEDGVAMGSPLAPTLASIFMKSLEDKMNAYPGEKPVLYKRYVDDVFLVFRNQSLIEPFLTFMNGLHPNIKFTTELEVDNKLPFLDILVTRMNGGYKTELFRKATDTGLYTTPQSFCEEKYREGMIKGLVHRVWNLSSSFEIANQGLNILRRRLRDNMYTNKQIEHNIRVTLDKLCTDARVKKQLKEENTEEYKQIIKIPYSEGFRAFKKSICRTISSAKVVSVTSKVQSFLSNKSKTVCDLQANLVYKFNCHGCQNSYIGETNRHLKTRISEHSQMSRSSKVLDHWLCCKDRTSSISKDEFSVLQKGFDSHYERQFCESLLIRHYNPSINIQNGQSKVISILKIFN